MTTLRSIDKTYVEGHIEALRKTIANIDSVVDDKLAVIRNLEADIRNLSIVRDGYKKTIANMRGEL